MPCNNQHVRILNENELSNLTHHQMHEHGFRLSENVMLDINALGDSQARVDGRHKSVHQAFALGYSNGIRDFINL